MVSPRRAQVRRAVGVYCAGGHFRGARTTLLLVVLAVTLLHLLPMPAIHPLQLLAADLLLAIVLLLATVLVLASVLEAVVLLLTVLLHAATVAVPWPP